MICKNGLRLNMNNLKKISLVLPVLFIGVIYGKAQNATGTLKRDIVFSAIKGTVSKPDSLLLPVSAQSVNLVSGDIASFKIVSYKKGKLILVFTPAIDFTGITKAKLQVSNSANKSIGEINLTGLSTKGLEGENEAPLSLIIDALGKAYFISKNPKNFTAYM